MVKWPRHCFKAQKSASLVPRGIFFLLSLVSPSPWLVWRALREPHSGWTSEGSSPTTRVCADKDDGNSQARHPLYTFCYDEVYPV